MKVLLTFLAGTAWLWEATGQATGSLAPARRRGRQARCRRAGHGLGCGSPIGPRSDEFAGTDGGCWERFVD